MAPEAALWCPVSRRRPCPPPTTGILLLLLLLLLAAASVPSACGLAAATDARPPPLPTGSARRGLLDNGLGLTPQMG
jgi:alpha-galactosidase